MRKCEDENMICVDVENVKQTPTIRRTLHSDTLGKNGLSQNRHAYKAHKLREMNKSRSDKANHKTHDSRAQRTRNLSERLFSESMAWTSK